MSPAISRPLGRCGLLLALVLLLLPLAGPTWGETPQPPTITTGLAFTITDPRVTESSGLARDTDNNVFWTVNDSGDEGIVYAIGPDGRTRGTVRYNADPVDVEALAYVDRRLYIADIGDNARQRETIRLYVIDYPVPGRDRGNSFYTYELRYPDGPHDAEAVLLDEDGQLQVITKARNGAIYRAPNPLTTGAVNELVRVADAPAWATGATVLPSGNYAVRTYLTLEVLDRQEYTTVARSTLPFQPQGESLTLSMSDGVLLIGSEGVASRVLRVPVPTAVESDATGAQSPPPSPDPTPVPETATSTEGVNRSGTLLALALATAVALAAGAVVFLRDRAPESVEDVVPRRQQTFSPAPDHETSEPENADAETSAAGESGNPQPTSRAPWSPEIDQPTVQQPRQPAADRPWAAPPRGQHRWDQGSGGSRPDDDPTTIRKL